MRSFFLRIKKGGKGKKSVRGGSEGASSSGSLPQPEPRVVAGGDHDQGRRDVEVAGQSKPNQEEGDVDGKTADVDRDPSPSLPSTLEGGKPDSTWRRLMQLLPLIACLDNTNTSAVPDNVHEALNANQNELETASGNKSNWKPTASATAKLLLRGVRDSTDAFTPLKSVAASLCFILENYEVRLPL